MFDVDTNVQAVFEGNCDSLTLKKQVLRYGFHQLFFSNCFTINVLE